MLCVDEVLQRLRCLRVGDEPLMRGERRMRSHPDQCTARTFAASREDGWKKFNNGRIGR